MSGEARVEDLRARIAALELELADAERQVQETPINVLNSSTGFAMLCKPSHCSYRLRLALLSNPNFACDASLGSPACAN
jgi:hypothetical protein